MELGKRYTTKQGGTIRTPLKFSEDNRFVYAKVEYSNKTIYKWYFKNARQFEVKIN